MARDIRIDLLILKLYSRFKPPKQGILLLWWTALRTTPPQWGTKTMNSDTHAAACTLLASHVGDPQENQAKNAALHKFVYRAHDLLSTVENAFSALYATHVQKPEVGQTVYLK